MRNGVLALVFACCAAAQEGWLPPPHSGSVVGVTDGDSVVLLNDKRERIVVRLDGIDCPELGQDFGRRAKQFTSDLLFGRIVEVDPKSLDRYGRTVARVRIEGRDASVEIVRAGYAWHFLKYSSDPVLAVAEASARAEHRGLWALNNPVAPWDYRAGRAPVAAGASPFRGNTSSLVYHRAGCPQYGCKHCTVPFKTAEEAEAAGYRSARCCNR